MLDIILLLSLSVCIGIAGQIFYKNALSKIHTKTYFEFIKKALTSYQIWIGFFCVALGIAIWVMALSKGDLNLVKSLDGIQYILLMFAARLFLAEKIDRNKLIGTVIIGLGIVLVALS